MLRPLRTLLHLVLTAGLIGLAYLGAPLGVWLFSLLGELELLSPQERPARYMASMSLTPYPEPSEEVREVTEELLEPPAPYKSKDSTKKKTTEAPPTEALNSKGKPVPVSEASAPAGGSDAQRSGGKVKGPTQDGEGDRKQKCLPDNPDISKVSANKVRVKRELVDYYTSHLIQAQELADTHWIKNKEGETYGFRVLRVRCGNDLYQLGFRGGDVVMAVNDEPVTSVGQAITAYQRLRNKKRLSVTIRRNNQVMNLEFVLY